MTAEPQGDAQVEIGHVLFMDIVGFSKLLGDQQSDASQRLNQIVRETNSFRAADANRRLIRLPTGDGMALVFFTGPEAPVQCALEISRALQSSIPLRMGIHSGPVNKATDVDGRTNVTGSGINMAQRLMDCGDAGHILLSKRIAEDLAHYSKWRPHLHELGETEVKHGVKIDIFNFHNDEAGNSALPQKLKDKKVTATSPLARLAKPLMAAALLVAMALAGVWFFLHRAQNFAQTSVFPGKSIAVLPFKPLTASERDEILEAGMADTLITKLSNSHEIIVPSLSSVRKYADRGQDPVTTGRALRVNSILEGNVQKSGDRIRVHARLIKVADGSALWSGTFDEKFTDVFSVQDTISQKVAEAVAPGLSGEEQMRLTKQYTGNLEAYQLYLTGRYHWNKLIPPEIVKSIGFFQQAVEKDSNYALAYFGLAEAYRVLAITSDMPAKEVFPQAKAAAIKALQIDESLADPHATLAMVYMWFDWDWAASEREAKRAITLNPNSGFAHLAYAQLLSTLGRHAEAIPEAARGRELDPVSSIANTREGAMLYLARRNEQAAERLQKTVELDPNFWIAHLFLGQVYMQKGNYPKALAAFTKARELSRGNSETISMIGYVSARAGDAGKARAALDELKSLSAQRYIPPYNVAAVHMGLDEKDEAIAWLEKAYEERDVRLSFLKMDPKWDSFRSDPRFGAILKRIGLQ